MIIQRNDNMFVRYSHIYICIIHNKNNNNTIQNLCLDTHKYTYIYIYVYIYISLYIHIYRSILRKTAKLINTISFTHTTTKMDICLFCFATTSLWLLSYYTISIKEIYFVNKIEAQIKVKIFTLKLKE